MTTPNDPNRPDDHRPDDPANQPPAGDPAPYGQQPPAPGDGEAPQYGQQPPQYGQQPPQYGQQPPQYGQQPPQYGQEPAQYGQQPAAAYGGAPGYGAPAATASNGLAIGALVVGILSILTACFYGVPGLVLGVIAIVLAVQARKKVQQGVAGQGGLAKAGMITGIIGAVLGVIVIVLFAVGVSLFGDAIENCSDPDLTPEQQRQCIEDNL